MQDPFHRKRDRNAFDRLVVDIERIYLEHPPGSSIAKGLGSPANENPRLRALYRSRLLPLGHRRALFRIARQTHLDLSWFNEFRAYWSSILGGRPLWGPEDFYFLKNVYRVAFQDNQVPDTDDPRVHEEAWQKPEVLYQLFHQVYVEAFTESASILRQAFAMRPEARSLLEFGCATAPITTSLFDFFRPGEPFVARISDIQTVAFHYGMHKFRGRPNVKPDLLLPANNFQPTAEGPIDLIFCLTVFEHLAEPLEIARSFHRLLPRGGLLFFDYIKSEGEGLDTVRSARQRNEVLKFIGDNFDIRSGALSSEKSIGLTVASKK